MRKTYYASWSESIEIKDAPAEFKAKVLTVIEEISNNQYNVEGDVYWFFHRETLWSFGEKVILRLHEKKLDVTSTSRFCLSGFDGGTNKNNVNKVVKRIMSFVPLNKSRCG